VAENGCYVNQGLCRVYALVFFVLMRWISPTVGLTGALVTSAILIVCVRRESLKILELGSLLLFALLVAYTLAARPAWTVPTVRLAVDAGLLAIVLVSLAVRRPFTLQYAREQVPEQFWATPRFMAVNCAISSVWAGCFAVMVLADVAAEYVAAIPIWVDVAAGGGVRGRALVHALVSRAGAAAGEGRARRRRRLMASAT
jgi:hypothetical protein